MEIGLLVLLILAALVFGFFGKRRRQYKYKPFKPALSRQRPRGNVIPFDPISAKPKPVATILRGTAHIVDGDTLIIQKTQVRLFGIDAPELNHPYGKNAKWALVALCKGQKIRAEITAEDSHGRTVARCYLEDGRDISAEMVSQGMAIDWPKFSNGMYRSLEIPNSRRKFWLADARQKGRMDVWQRFEDRNGKQGSEDC